MDVLIIDWYIKKVVITIMLCFFFNSFYRVQSKILEKKHF